MTNRERLNHDQAARRLFSRFGWQMIPDADGSKHFDIIRDGETKRIHPPRLTHDGQGRRAVGAV